MTLRRALLPTLLGAAAVLGALGVRLWACGPGGAEVTFADVHDPDHGWAETVKGDLGILRPGLPEKSLVAAYRHLAGLPVDAAVWDPAPPKAADPDAAATPVLGPEERWREARTRAMGDAGPKLRTEVQRPDYSTHTRITDDALLRAAETLEARMKAYGVQTPAVQSWVRGQDLVFAATPESLLLPEPVVGPAWLKQDRAYQRAAALFYAERFDEARAAFAEVAKDGKSPWRPLAAYLQARCWYRQAVMAPPASLGPDPLAPAQRHLEALLKDPSLAPVHKAAEAYRELIRYRREPELLRAEALAALERRTLTAEAVAGALEVLAHAERPEASPFLAPVQETPDGDLENWLEAMGGRMEAETVLAQWKETPTVPWLVAALARLPLDHPGAAALRQAAAKVPAAHPASPTLRWQLMLAELPGLAPAKRRARLDAALKEPLAPWAFNELRARRRELATGLEDWAPALGSRAVRVTDGMEATWENQTGITGLPEGVAKHYGPDPELLAPELAASLDAQWPLARLAALAQAPGLPGPLREDLAHMAWSRAVLLERWDLAKALLPRLDPALRARAEKDLAVEDPELRRFRLVRIFLDFPGLSPHPWSGLGRGNYGGEAVKEMDTFGDNWWCGDGQPPKPVEAAPPAFLDAAALQAAGAENEALRKLPSARHWFGRTAVAYAKAHPEDPAAPEALADFVRLTKNAPCYDDELKALGRQAFQMLHKRFAGTDAAKRTPYHY